MDETDKQKMAELEKDIKEAKAGVEEMNKKHEAAAKIAIKVAKHAADQMDEKQQAKFKAEMEKDDDIKAGSEDKDLKETVAGIYDNVKKDENYHGPGNEPKVAALQAEVERLTKAPLIASIMSFKGLEGKDEEAKLFKASKSELAARIEELQFMAKSVGSEFGKTSTSRLDLGAFSANVDADINTTSQFSGKTDEELLKQVGGW